MPLTLLVVLACGPGDAPIDVSPVLPVWLAAGGGPTDFEEAFGVTDAGDGTVVAVGFVGEAASFLGPDQTPVPLPAVGGAGDMFVARFDADTGAALSGFTIGGDGYDVGWDVSGTGDGGFWAIGHHTGDATVGPADDPVSVPGIGEMSVVVGSWDADDRRRCLVRVGDAGGALQLRVHATRDGGVLWTARSHAGTVVAPGTRDEVVPPSHGGEDLLVGKLTAAGRVAWVRTYGGPGDEWFGTPAETDDGYLVSGLFTGAADFGGRTLTSTSAEGEAFVARFLWDGTALWATSFPSARASGSRRTVITDDGGVVVGGKFLGDVTFDPGGPAETRLEDLGDGDAYLARLRLDDGSFAWARRLGTPQLDWVDGLAALPGGGVAAVGVVNYGGPPDRAAALQVDGVDAVVPVTWQTGWLARFDPAGDLITLDTWPQATARQGIVLPGSDLVAVGGFRSGASFGDLDAPVSHGGGWDPYLLRVGD